MARRGDLQFDFEQYGMTFLAGQLHRLRVLISSQSDAIFEESGISVPSHCASLMLLLEQHDEAPVMSIADALGYSHQLITQRLSILEKHGFLRKFQDSVDRRRSVVTLTTHGRKEAKKIHNALRIVDAGLRNVTAETSVDLQHSVDEVSELLGEQSLSVRGRAARTPLGRRRSVKQ